MATTAPAPDALRGVRVLVPRAPGRGASFARLVEAAGGEAVVAPLISRAAVGPHEQTVLDTAVAEVAAGAYAWVVVTSVNAVDEILAAAQRVGVTPRELSAGALWAAVGPATSRALGDAGVVVALLPLESSATGLLDVWPTRPDALARSGAAPAASAEAGVPAEAGAPAEAPTDSARLSAQPTAPRRVLLPLGDLAHPTLERGLTERGFVPDRVTAYRTVAHAAPEDVVTQWLTGRVDAVVLTSGSVVREVARQLGPRPDVLAVAIGEPTRRAADAAGQPVAAVARSATDDGLLDALVRAVADRSPPG